MAQSSRIEWTDATWNPVAGCTPASEGCRNCYAARMALRLDAMGVEKYRDTARKTKAGRPHFSGRIRLDEDALDVPRRWRLPRTIFVNSMSDLCQPSIFLAGCPNSALAPTGVARRQKGS